MEWATWAFVGRACQFEGIYMKASQWGLAENHEKMLMGACMRKEMVGLRSRWAGSTFCFSAALQATWGSFVSFYVRYPPTGSSYWWRWSHGDPGLTVELALSPWRVGENTWSSGSRGCTGFQNCSVHNSLTGDPALASGNVLGRSNTRTRSGRCHEEGVKGHDIHLDITYGFMSVVVTAYFHKMFLQCYHLS